MMISNFLNKLIILVLSIIYQETNGILLDGIEYTPKGDTITPSIELNQNEALISQNNRFALALQPNGNLVIYFIQQHRLYGKPLWQSESGQEVNNGEYTVKLTYSANGILSIYSKLTRNAMNNGVILPNNLEIWRFNGDLHPAGEIKLQSDGNFCMYNPSGHAIWSTMTNYQPNYFHYIPFTESITVDGIKYTTQTDKLFYNNPTGIPLDYGAKPFLKAYTALISRNEKYALAMNPNGNLILYFIVPNHWAYGTILWQSASAVPGYTATVPDDLWLYFWQSDYILHIYRMDLVRSSNSWDNGELWRANNHGTCAWCKGFAMLQDDGNFVMYDGSGNPLWSTLNSYDDNYRDPVDSYSRADGTYKWLVTYIGHGDESYLTARQKNYEWCLSAGHIEGDKDEHDLQDDEHNLYWCDNYASANQNCKCLGLKDDGNGHFSYQVNGITYILERDADKGDGNEIQSHEHNLKADPNGNPDDFDWGDGWSGSGRKLCHSWTASDGEAPLSRKCCIEHDKNVELFIDIIDGTHKHGREAKCDSNAGVWSSEDSDLIQWKLVI